MARAMADCRSAADAEEAFRRPLPGQEFAIARIDVAGQQVGAVGVGARHDQRGHAHHIGRQPCRHQLLDGFDGRHQDFAAQVAAFLGGRKLVFEVHAGRARFDHGFHQFKGIEVAAETGFSIRDQRSKPVDAILAFGVVNLVGAHERLIDAAAEVGDAIGGIEALVGVHLSSVVGVGGNLPAAYVDRLQPGFHLLDGLITGHGAERGDIGVAL